MEAGNAIPGDALLFTITYTNQGLEPAENVVLTYLKEIEVGGELHCAHP